MKKTSFYLMLFTLLMFDISTSAQTNDTAYAKIKGSWMGMLKIPQKADMKVILIFSKVNNELKAILKSPDQTTREFPADMVSFKSNNIHIEINSLYVTYEAVFQDKDTTISGTFVQGNFTSDLDLKPFKQNRLQEPKLPYPYISKDIEFPNEKAGIILAGTLTQPATGGPFPVVVLISGSSAQNRNEEVFGHKPFLVLADYLTRQGIAVLRFDDRGTGKSTGHYAGSTIPDFATDVIAAIDFLKKDPTIDKTKIGLIGHSEGGMIAPLIASQNQDVAFIVMMAGPGIPGDQLMLYQAEQAYKNLKVGPDVIEINKKLREKIFKELKKGQDSATTIKKIIKLYSKLTEDELNKLLISKDKINQIASLFMYPEIISLIKFVPEIYLEKVKCPVLAINGEKDVQVPAKVNLKAIEEALKKGGNKNFTVKELWLMNHLFQIAETGAVTEYEQIEETISPIALETIGEWIGRVVVNSNR